MKNNKYIKFHPHINKIATTRILTILTSIFPITTHAECTPTPDCADMGYTETSCDGKFVRCPFDTSQLFCIPCDSQYQYSCLGNNISEGIGNSCANKYISCSCIAGATFINGSCICDTSCTVGNIYYSDNSCSSCIDNSKTAVGVVVKDNEIIASIDIQYQQWSADMVNISSIVETTDIPTAKNDFAGSEHTSKIVQHYGTNTDTSTNAGLYCYQYDLLA